MTSCQCGTLTNSIWQVLPVARDGNAGAVCVPCASCQILSCRDTGNAPLDGVDIKTHIAVKRDTFKPASL